MFARKAIVEWGNVSAEIEMLAKDSVSSIAKVIVRGNSLEK